MHVRTTCTCTNHLHVHVTWFVTCTQVYVVMMFCLASLEPGAHTVGLYSVESGAIVLDGT